MSTVPKFLMSESEYLEFERASEMRHEFWRGELFAMAGASEGHNLASGNLLIGRVYRGWPELTELCQLAILVAGAP